MKKMISFLIASFVSAQAYSQILVEDGNTARPTAQPNVGRSAATEYFKKREKANVEEPARDKATVETSDRIMALHIGTFLNDKAYRWGSKNRVEDPGKAMFGVTYRVGEWTSSMDLYIRAELMNYEIDSDRPLKLSVMPIVAFPDVRSDFPLYFGAGAGAGIFFNQAGEESDLSFDYALIIGTRFPSIFDWGGLFIESGLKGHVHLTSSGQHDGVFLAGGAIFSF